MSFTQTEKNLKRYINDLFSSNGETGEWEKRGRNLRPLPLQFTIKELVMVIFYTFSTNKKYSLQKTDKGNYLLVYFYFSAIKLFLPEAKEILKIYITLYFANNGT